MTSSSKVSVGLGTVAGLGTAFSAFIGGIVAILLDGDHSPETITAFATGTVALVTTLLGRFSQAKEQIRATATVTAASAVVLDAEAPADVERGLGAADEPYYDEPDFDPALEKRDIHDATGI